MPYEKGKNSFSESANFSEWNATDSFFEVWMVSDIVGWKLSDVFLRVGNRPTLFIAQIFGHPKLRIVTLGTFQPKVSTTMQFAMLNK